MLAKTIIKEDNKMGDLARVNTNVAALRAFLTLSTINTKIIGQQERISTGKVVNRASDNPANYFVSQTFPIVVESDANRLVADGGTWNNSLPYFLFSAFIIFIIFFTWKWIPETKGKTLEEMEATFNPVKG